MASYYSRRIYSLQVPGHQRVHHARRQSEPVFDVGMGELPQSAAAADRASSAAARESHDGQSGAATESTQAVAVEQTRSRMNGQSSSSPRATELQAPPPAYGTASGTGHPIPLVRTTSSGRTLVNPTGSSRLAKTVKIQWAYHPATSGAWYIFRLYRFLATRREVLQDDFPDDFEEIMDDASVPEPDQNKVKELFAARMRHLNDWVLPKLAVTRLWMAIVEIVGLAVIAFFVVALALTRAEKAGVMQAAVVTLIIAMLLAAGLVNQTRLRRWWFQSELRLLSREWSPGPASSSSTASPEVLRAYAGQRLDMYLQMSGHRRSRSVEICNTEDGLKPVMRWTMTRREGSVWTGWRPVVNVELIVPNISAAATLATPAPTFSQSPAEDYVPKYTRRQTAGERTVSFSH